MSALVEETFEAPAGKYLVDSYEDWARGEGVPVHAGKSVDLMTASTADWTRFGVRGAAVHLDGHCDFLTIFLMEIASGASSAPQHHLYEEICYVLAGSGETEIESGAGKRVIAWKPGSLFAAPMNARYRHRCASGEPARLVCVNDLRYLMNLYRNENFLFNTPLTFDERGEGDVAHDLSTKPTGAGVWAGEKSSPLALARGSIGVDVVEMPAGTYGQARRQVYGSLLLGIAGAGMTVSFADPDGARERLDWKSGVACAPKGLVFHQHFNVGAAPARFLRIEFGTMDFPIMRPRARAYGDASVYASGAAEVPFAEEKPEIRRDWLETLKKAGVQSRM